MAGEAMIRVTVGERTGTFAPGTTVSGAVNALMEEEQARRVLCVMRGGVCVELAEPLTQDCTLEPLTYQDEEGRRVYERSLRFLFLLSLKRLYPEKRVRMLNSVGYGLYIRLLEGEIGHEMTRAIEEDMRELVRQAREAGMDEVDIAPNVTAAASQDYAAVEEEMCRIIEAARGEIRLVPMLWMVKFSFETVDGLCRVYKRLGIDSVKTSAGIHFGEMLVEHIEWLHRNYPEFCIEVAGRTRQREKAEAMFRAGASFIHTGSWRKLSGIGTDPAFDGATKECSAGKFTNYLQEAGK